MKGEIENFKYEDTKSIGESIEEENEVDFKSIINLYPNFDTIRLKFEGKTYDCI